MAKRPRTSRGILVASTNETKQNAIIISLKGFEHAYKKYGILRPALLIAMQYHILNT